MKNHARTAEQAERHPGKNPGIHEKPRVYHRKQGDPDPACRGGLHERAVRRDHVKFQKERSGRYRERHAYLRERTQR